jgi:hypothetical protein
VKFRRSRTTTKAEPVTVAAASLTPGDHILDPNGGKKVFTVASAERGFEGRQAVVYVVCTDNLKQAFCLPPDEQVLLAP